MADHVASSGMSRPTRAVPWPVWLMLAGAVVQLVVQIAPDWYQVFGPYFIVSWGMVVNWIGSVAPFVLAAVVVLAADRWPAGRRLLLAGAAAMAVAALHQVVSDAWWAIWQANPGPLAEGIQPWLSATYLGAEVARIAAYGLVASGLWAARPAGPAGRSSGMLMLLLGLAGLVATGAGVWVVGLALEGAGSADSPWLVVTGSALKAAGFAALAAVGVAAARLAGRTGRRPETLIATGAFVTLVATAWTWTVPHIAPTQAWSDDGLAWAFTVPNTMAVLGMYAMIAGFVLGATAARWERAVVEPTT